MPQEQTRRIDGRPQVNTQISSGSLDVVARPVNYYVDPGTIENNPLYQLATSLHSISPALTNMMAGYQQKQEQIDKINEQKQFDLGNLQGMLQKDPRPNPSPAYLAGYGKARAIADGMDLTDRIAQEVDQINVADTSTWGQHKTPTDAVKAILNTRTEEAIRNVDPSYAQYMVAAVKRQAGNLVEQKRKEEDIFHSNRAVNDVTKIVNESLKEASQNPNVTPEAVHQLWELNHAMLTANGLIDNKTASKILAEQFGNFAADNARPDLLAFMDVKGKDGIAPSMTNAGDALRSSLEKAKRNYDRRLDVNVINYKANVDVAVDNGEVTPDNIADIINNSPRPDMYSNDELAKILSRSMLKKQELSIKKVEDDTSLELFRQGRAYEIPDDAAKGKAYEAYRQEVLKQTGGDPAQTTKVLLNVLNNNSFVDPNFKAILNNGALLSPDDLTKGVPKGFMEATQLFEDMYRINPDMAMRHVTDKDALNNILRFREFKVAHTDEEAYARVQQIKSKPTWEADTYSKPNFHFRVSQAIQALPTEDFRTSGTIGNAFYAKVQGYGRLGIGEEEAFKLATNFVENNYAMVNGVAVYTGGNKYPDDLGDFSSHYVKNTLGKDPKDVVLVPDSTRNGVLWPTQANGIRTGDVPVDFSKAYSEYKKITQPTWMSANDMFFNKLKESQTSDRNLLEELSGAKDPAWATRLKQQLGDRASGIIESIKQHSRQPASKPRSNLYQGFMKDNSNL